MKCIKYKNNKVSRVTDEVAENLVANNKADYISKSEQLANDVVFIARSLGFAAYVAFCFKKAQTGNGGIYHRVSIEATSPGYH